MLLRYRAMAFGFVAAVALLQVAPVVADPHALGDQHDQDHDAARRAVQRGEIRPLVDLLGIVRDKLPGEITGVELERERGRWLYEFRVIDKAGRLFEVYVDAETGDIKNTKEK
jgi:uncharacterized membrane protein YkoI